MNKLLAVIGIVVGIFLTPCLIGIPMVIAGIIELGRDSK
jgi:hypothetical protein